MVGDLAWLAAGVAYLFLVEMTGISLPCLFHVWTGLYCPGCGATRMFQALLQGDLWSAWQANAALLLSLPFLLFLWAVKEWRYIRQVQKESFWQQCLAMVLLLFLLLFAVWRNLSLLLDF